METKERLREYETIYIVRPDATEEVLARTNRRVYDVVERHKGKMVRFENWGRKRLAFHVAKNPKGIVMLAGYLAKDPETIEEIRRSLRMQDDVVRIHSKRVAEGIDPESRAAVEWSDEKSKIVDVADEPVRAAGDWRDDRGPRRRDEEFGDAEDDYDMMRDSRRGEARGENAAGDDRERGEK